ncbi:dihydrolipoyl dehydrogenase family protein [Companilactobacillus huachuanensis]|uniref:Dihydrolipoyl dehydrogenase family protein n=1 Tax=Companilactobacillus huachuanensis TaxID=2559914 RepID=A0ABW1RMW3_9LACO|nr:NAD(P)/FAD-dependent oxidoreductase [Companilactobacillus huachuanensis]
MSMSKFDLIVIGGGVGGAGVAIKASSYGQKVAIIEQRDWGGTTVNRGSTPKKVLLAAAEAHRHFETQVFSETTPDINWEKLAAYRDNIVNQTAVKFKTRFQSNGITTYEGHAEFLNNHEVTVNGQTLSATNIVTASGAHPKELRFSGSQFVQHSGSFFRSEQLPSKIVIMGAGIIAFAMASIANEAGAEVVMLQHDAVALRGYDHEFVGLLIDDLKQRGVRFQFNNEVKEIKSVDNCLHVLTQQSSITTDVIYTALGREANISGLHLEQAGVKYTKHGISVNDYLQTSQSNIYAVGDCAVTGVPQLANYAIYQGKYLGDSLSKTLAFPIKYQLPVTAVFSMPRLAQAGVTVQQANEQSDKYQVKSMSLAHWLNYQRNHDEQARLKLIINRQSQQVVGAEAYSYSADDLINYLAILIQQNISVKRLHDLFLAYPSTATDLYGIWV